MPGMSDFDLDAVLAENPVVPPPPRRNFDPDQQKVLAWNRGEAVVAAGAGSGKTTTLIEWIARRVEEGVDPRQIGAFAYNSSAGAKLIADVGARLGARGDEVEAGTMHRACFKVLREAHPHEPRFKGKDHILDRQKDADEKKKEEDKEKAAAARAVDAGLSEEEQEALEAQKRRNEPPTRSTQVMLPIISGKGAVVPIYKQEASAAQLVALCAQAREAMIDVEEPGRDLDEFLEHVYEDRKLRQRIARAFALFQARKAELQLIDFADMLYLLWKGIRDGKPWAVDARGRYPYAAMDEAQDTNPIRAEIFDWLAADGACQLWIGDFRQSIYAFQGARPDLLKRRLDGGATLLPMRYNYRSDGAIVGAANRFATGASWHIGGDSLTPPGVAVTPGAIGPFEGSVVQEIISAVRGGAPVTDFCILSRTNAGLAGYEAGLARAKIPFYSTSGRNGPWTTVPGLDMLAFHRIAEGQATVRDFYALMNTPLRYVSNAMLTAAIGEKSDAKAPQGVERTAQARTEPMRKYADDLFDLRGVERWSDRCEMIGGWLELNERRRHEGTKLEADEDTLKMISELTDLCIGARSWQGVRELVRQAREGQTRASEPHVHLSTVHKSKGGQWPIVFLDCANMPHPKAGDEEEEARIFYVAMTRAERRCYLVNDEESDFAARALGQ